MPVFRAVHTGKRFVELNEVIVRIRPPNGSIGCQIGSLLDGVALDHRSIGDIPRDSAGCGSDDGIIGYFHLGGVHGPYGLGTHGHKSPIP